MKANIWRALIEIGLIIFLLYSSLLTKEFTHSGIANNRGLLWAVEDVFTKGTFCDSSHGWIDWLHPPRIVSEEILRRRILQRIAPRYLSMIGVVLLSRRKARIHLISYVRKRKNQLEDRATRVSRFIHFGSSTSKSHILLNSDLTANADIWAYSTVIRQLSKFCRNWIGSL